MCASGVPLAALAYSCKLLTSKRSVLASLSRAAAWPPSPRLTPGCAARQVLHLRQEAGDAGLEGGDQLGGRAAQDHRLVPGQRLWRLLGERRHRERAAPAPRRRALTEVGAPFQGLVNGWVRGASRGARARPCVEVCDQNAGFTLQAACWAAHVCGRCDLVGGGVLATGRP